MQITPQVHKIGNFVNQYLLIDGESVSLIDTGMSSNAKAILKYIENLGFKPENLKNILITHADPDHYGAANEIRQHTGASIWTSQIEADAMESGSSSREIKPKGFIAIIFPLLQRFLVTTPTPVDKIVKDGDVLPINGGLHVISAPGHTPGHIAFYLPKDRILFAGDAVTIVNKHPDAITDARTNDTVTAKKTFTRLMDLKPAIVCAGHAFFYLRSEK